MTVHSAKGLQAPVVILADASESENLPSDTVFWHEGKPLISNALINDTTMKSIKNEYKEKLKEESMCLLYVAMTRAGDELYACGQENKSQDSWYKIIAGNSEILEDEPEKQMFSNSETKHFASNPLPRFPDESSNNK